MEGGAAPGEAGDRPQEWPGLTGVFNSSLQNKQLALFDVSYSSSLYRVMCILVVLLVVPDLKL